MCFVAAADRVYAQPATITGGIGSTSKNQSLLHSAKKLGIDVEVISAGKNAGMHSEFVTLSKEQRQIRQRLIDRQAGSQHTSDFTIVLSTGSCHAVTLSCNTLNRAGKGVFLHMDSLQHAVIEQKCQNLFITCYAYNCLGFKQTLSSSSCVHDHVHRHVSSRLMHSHVGQATFCFCSSLTCFAHMRAQSCLGQKYLMSTITNMFKMFLAICTRLNCEKAKVAFAHL